MSDRNGRSAHEVRRECGAKTRAGGTCKQLAMDGQKRCWLHGGKTPAKLAKVRREKALAVARREVARLGLSMDADPLDALLEQVREAHSNVAMYRLAIESLGMHVGDGGVAVSEVFDAKGARSPAVPHVLVAMYDQERERLVRFAKICVDAGVEERIVRVVEMQAEMAWQTVAAGLDALNLSAGDREVFGRAFAQALQATG